jgi:hypothetical protein
VTDRDLRGAELARRFFIGVVEPLLSQALPGLRYAAARLGSGSDVLGLDDEMSRDHDWGCRLTLLVDEDDRDQVQPIGRMLEEGLPERFGQFPVRFRVTWDSSVSHKVEVATVADFVASRLGVAPTGGLSVLDWLSMTGQSVLEVTAGPVFTDRTHTLAAVRTLLAWYPADVELYVLAAALPVAANGGPDRRGRRRTRLPAAGRRTGRGPALAGVHAVPAVGALRQVARHRLPLAPRRSQAQAPARRGRRSARMAGTRDRPGQRLRGAPGNPARTGRPAPESAVVPFFDRPYRAVPQRLLSCVTDPDVARLPPMVGSIEQWVDCTDVLASPGRRAAVQTAYRAWADAG